MTSQSRSARPNIILILADDMGYSDIGCYGSEIATPNLDALGRGGMRFTQMYNCARCCPTRASLLTGLHPHQTGVGFMVGDMGHPSYQGYLNDRCVTMAEALKPAGYRTMMSGKWHVGGPYAIDHPEQWRPGAPQWPIPIQRGFDEHFGMLGGASSYFDPHSVIRQDRLIRLEGEYFTDAVTDRAIDMINRSAGSGEPFFLYLAYTAPHWPLHAHEEDIARYEGKYTGGWDAVRTARHECLKAMGLLNPKWPISPRDTQAPPWADLSAKRRDWEQMRMAVYAAQVDRLDQGIGRVLARLRELNLADNTILMFLSDNGGCAEFLREDGAWGSAPARTFTGKDIRCGNIPGLRPGPADTFMSYDLPWANASNSPFRLYKHWVHEGGTATPFIVHWPAGIKAGGISHQPLHVADIMATCLDAAGAEYPQSREGNPVTPLEGESFAPLLAGRHWTRRQAICLEHEGNRAVRLGNWKLVSKFPGPWGLYDMDADRTELNDLAASNPARVNQMAAMYDEWALRAGVQPWEKIRRGH